MTATFENRQFARSLGKPIASFAVGVIVGIFVGYLLALSTNRTLPDITVAPSVVDVETRSSGSRATGPQSKFHTTPNPDIFAAIYVYPYSGATTSPREKSQEVIDYVLGQQRPFSQAHQDFMILKLIDLMDRQRRGMDIKHSLPPRSYGAKIQDIADIVKSSSDSVFRKSTEKRRYFIDLAANDAIRLSNTLLLEAAGWDGLCVEPNSIYWYGLARWRSCTVVGAVVGKDHEVVAMNLKSETGTIANGIQIENGTVNETTRSTIVDDGRITTAFETSIDKDGEMRIKYSASIATLLHRFNVPPVIDYFSLDVEGAETIVMEGFPFEEFKALFMTIERPNPTLTRLLVIHGYIPIVNIATFGDTLWMHSSVPMSVERVRAIALAYSPEGRKPALWNGGAVFQKEQKLYI